MILYCGQFNIVIMSPIVGTDPTYLWKSTGSFEKLHVIWKLTPKKSEGTVKRLL